MKFSKMSQLFLVSSIGLLLATFLTACQIVTIDYLFVADSAGSGTSSNGQIEVYAVDSQSGAVRTAGAAVSSGGTQPVAMATTSDYSSLYVANQGNNTLVHFTVALSGAITAKDTVTLSSEGNTPVALAVNAANTYLYVVNAYAPGCSSSSPCAGTLAVFPIASSGTLGTPLSNGGTPYWPIALTGSYSTDIVIPTAVTVLADNAAVYVAAYDQSAYNPTGTVTSSANPGWVFGYAVGSGGVLTASSGSPYKAGVKPASIVADPTDRFVYVTDFASNEMIGYTIQSGNILNFLTNGPFKTGGEPSSIAIDPRGKFIYVANALDSTVGAYVIDLSTGTPSAAVNPTGSASNSTDTQPVSIVVDPAVGRFVLTANYLGNSVSGFTLDATAGTLSANQASPYPTGYKPTAVVAIPHGNHSTQTTTP